MTDLNSKTKQKQKSAVQNLEAAIKYVKNEQELMLPKVKKNQWDRLIGRDGYCPTSVPVKRHQPQLDHSCERVLRLYARNDQQPQNINKKNMFASKRKSAAIDTRPKEKRSKDILN